MEMTPTRKALYELTGWHRKPESWGEVGSAITLDLLSELPQYTSAELGIQHHIYAEFKIKPVDVMFLVAHKSALYLVRTEGSNYARYVRYVGVFVPLQTNGAQDAA